MWSSVPDTVWHLVRYTDWTSQDLAALKVIERLVVPGGDLDVAGRRATRVANQVGGPARVVEKVSGRVVATVHPEPRRTTW